MSPVHNQSTAKVRQVYETEIKLASKVIQKDLYVLYVSRDVSSWSPTVPANHPTKEPHLLDASGRRKGLESRATRSHLMLRYWRHRSPNSVVETPPW